MSNRSLLVRCDPTSASDVRHTIADDLRDHGVGESSIDDVVLVASELLGNAIVHTTDHDSVGLHVRWELDADCVTVYVHDHSERRPEPRQAGPDRTNGRGLAIVAALATEWGVHAAPRGKQVWAQVPVRTARSHRQPA